MKIIKMAAILIILLNNKLLAEENSCKLFYELIERVNVGELNIGRIIKSIKAENGNKLKNPDCKSYYIEHFNHYENELYIFISRTSQKTEGYKDRLVLMGELIYITDGSMTSALLDVVTSVFYNHTQVTASFIMKNKLMSDMFESIINPSSELINGQNKCELFKAKISEIKDQNWSDIKTFERVNAELTNALKWECT
ncbi:MAG: hypothetical protein Q9M92_06855 [Enterobacterales bacterium]|nr:hypothetical protein [Enterobacterales bacterium]